MLERQNDRLKEFTDILAHDLRNPSNVIDGRFELVQQTREDEPLEHNGTTTDRMERLVDDLLRVARQGNVVTDPEPTHLEAVIEPGWEGTGSLADQATLVYGEVGSVGGDHDRLRAVFGNRFRTAVEHGGSDVKVRVSPLDRGGLRGR